MCSLQYIAKPGLFHCSQSNRKFLHVPLVAFISVSREIRDLVSRACCLVAIYHTGVTAQSSTDFPFLEFSAKARCPWWQRKRQGMGPRSAASGAPQIWQMSFTVTWGTPKGPQFYEPGETTQQLRSLSTSAPWGRSKALGIPERTCLSQSQKFLVEVLFSLFCWKTNKYQELWGSAAGCAACALNGVGLHQFLICLKQYGLAGRNYPIQWNSFPIWVGSQTFVCSARVGVLCYIHLILQR